MKFEVIIPVTGYITVLVEADTRGEASELAIEKADTKNTEDCRFVYELMRRWGCEATELREDFITDVRGVE